MSKSMLSAKHFQDEEAAYRFLERIVWPQGPVCPHCGGFERIGRLKGTSTRPGVYKCYQCRKPFRVTVGTVFESSHIPLRMWLQAMFLMQSSKKGISSNQLSRTLGVTVRTAWFMSHRLRLAMTDGSLAPMGGGGGIVEIDETVFGKIEGAPKKKNLGGRSGYRNVALTLVERGGAARSFHVSGTTVAELKPIIRANIARDAAIMTDQAAWYPEIGAEFASHDTVNHAKDEYVRREGEKMITTNAVEGYYSIFKRGMKGIYQHCSERHLHRYLAEFDFRYSHRVRLGIDDAMRTEIALRGIVGKRLTYRTAH